MKRSRYTGSSEPLLAVLRQHVKNVRAIKYAVDSSIDKEGLSKHGALLKALHDIQANLSFTKSSLKQAFAELLDEHPTWLPQTDHQDWIDTMAKRLATMCRHVAQTLLKSGGKAKWLTLLGFEAEEPPPGEFGAPPVSAAAKKATKMAQSADADKLAKAACSSAKVSNKKGEELADHQEGGEEEEAVHDPEEVVYHYGFCRELLTAWRVPIDGGNKEQAVFAGIPKNAQPFDAIFAKWADGHSASIPDVLIAEFKELTEAKSRLISTATPSSRSRILWNENNLRIKYSPQKGRHDLLILYGQNENGGMMQLCQLNSQPNQEKALKVLKTLAIKYSEGEIDKKSMNTEKHKLLDEMLTETEKASKPVKREKDSDGQAEEAARPPAVLKKPAAKKPAATCIKRPAASGKATSTKKKQKVASIGDGDEAAVEVTDESPPFYFSSFMDEVYDD
jgi:hypothetical protein